MISSTTDNLIAAHQPAGSHPHSGFTTVKILLLLLVLSSGLPSRLRASTVLAPRAEENAGLAGDSCSSDNSPLLAEETEALTNSNFITKWYYTSASTSILFKAQTAGGAVDYTWSASPSGNSGSGNFTQTTAGSVTLSGLTIAAGDTVTLVMQPANLRRFYIDQGAHKNNLVAVANWGAVPWISMSQAFSGCINLQLTATDAPNLSAVTSMFEMFSGATSFNQDISNWNTAAVMDMVSMFAGAVAFNQPIGNWNTAKVTSIASMFSGAKAFNQDISSWNTAAMTNMESTFFGATAFNQPIGSWNTAKVTNMTTMFLNAVAFNQDISNWNTALVTNMSGMFYGATAFNQPIGGWNTEKMINMNAMFEGATAFNQPIGNWNMALVTNMGNMFRNATAFNQPIGTWNTALVTNMSQMFQNATAFNQPLGSWNTAAVTNMSSMFKGAAAFNQPLGSWQLNASVNLGSMLDNAGLDCENYSLTLSGWAANTATPSGRSLGASTRQYGADAAAARTTLVSTK
ncbi:MAG: hypothetical protein RI973_1282, partial [Bacteroidota bacterium]